MDDNLQQLDRALLHQQQTLLRQWSSSQTRSPHFAAAKPPLLSAKSPHVSPLLRPRSLTLEDDFSLEDEGPLTVMQVIFNLANIIVGAGVLSVPYAFKQSGYFTVLIIMLVIGITDTTGKWIGSALRMAGDAKGVEAVPANARDFAFLAEVALGRRMRGVINFVTILEVWFACVTFMVMNGDNVKTVLPSLAPAISVPVTGAMATVLCLVPENAFAYLSLISSLSLLTAVVAMVGATWMLSEWAEPYARLGSSTLIHVENIPQSVGIVMFCFAGHPVFPAVYASMKDTKKWDWAIDITFLLAFVFYGSVGFVGYVVFGSGLDATVTENLTDIHGILALWCQDIAALGFLVKVQLTAPLMLKALMVAIWPPVQGGPEWPPGRLLQLAALGSATVLVAMALRDSVAAVAGLTGSFCVMTTSVLFPAVAHLALSCSSGESGPGRPQARTCLAYIGTVVFGGVMAVLGTASAVRDLMA